MKTPLRFTSGMEWNGLDGRERPTTTWVPLFAGVVVDVATGDVARCHGEDADLGRSLVCAVGRGVPETSQGLLFGQVMVEGLESWS